MGQCLDNFGTILGPFEDNCEDHFRIILGLFWDHFGTILGPFWDLFGTTLGPFWNPFRTILEPFWNHIGTILGPFSDLKKCSNFGENKKSGHLIEEKKQFSRILGIQLH